MSYLGHRHMCACDAHADSASRPGRRGFLQALGAFAALGAALPGCSTSAPAAASAAPTWIDTHHHFYPPEYQRAWLEWEDKRNIPHFTQQVGWSVDKALADMDAAGVRTAILSIASTPGVWFDWSVPEVARFARARAARRKPARNRERQRAAIAAEATHVTHAEIRSGCPLLTQSPAPAEPTPGDRP